MDGHSLNLTEERLKAFQNLLPEVFSEGKVDFQRLKEVLGEYTAPPDHYELTWAGKADARREIQRQTTATLIPDFAESVDFDTSQNVYIEGENLEVLRVLQRSYFGKVKMIYIDPPYNTGNDYFVYPDDYAERKEEYEKRAGQKDDRGFLNKLDLFKTNNGQLHSPWLSMMYPRLYMARNLLREDGVIFVSIDDNEAHNLKLLMDEVFGEENFITSIVWKRRQNVDSRSKKGASIDHEYLIVYGKSERSNLQGAEKDLTKYSNPDNDSRGDWMSADMTGLATKDQRPNLHYDLENPVTGIIYPCPPTGWRYEPKRMKQLIKNDEILFPSKSTGRPRRKKFLKDLESDFTGFSTIVDSIFNTQGTRELRILFDEAEYFDFPKPVDYLKKIVKQGVESSEHHIIFDFFAGSSSTAQAIFELNAEDGGNRRFVLVQLPEPTDPKSEAHRAGYESIAAIGRERIRRVIKKMHQAVEDAEKEVESAQKLIETLQKELADLQATKPELFGAKPSKETQKRTDKIEKAEESLTEAHEKAKRLRDAPKDFKAFRLAESNFTVWQSEATTKEQLKQQIIDFASPQRSDAESQAMLYEFLLKKGYPLTASVTREEIDGIAAYVVEKREMWVLLDGYSEAIKRRILTDKPKHVVCLDKIFAGNDQTLTNLHLDLRDRNIELSII